MQTILKGVLTATDLEFLRTLVARSQLVDGRLTSAHPGKKNLQLAVTSAEAREAGEVIVRRLMARDEFDEIVQPVAFHQPLISHYKTGMRYPDHIDVALMGGLRTDVAITVFISEPADYDGGELIIDLGAGQVWNKLQAGDAVAYPASSAHRVAEVTRGERIAAALWVQSRVRDPQQRLVLAQIATAARELEDTHMASRIRRGYHNLLRMWAETLPSGGAS